MYAIFHIIPRIFMFVAFALLAVLMGLLFVWIADVTQDAVKNLIAWLRETTLRGLWQTTLRRFWQNNIRPNLLYIAAFIIGAGLAIWLFIPLFLA